MSRIKLKGHRTVARRSAPVCRPRPTPYAQLEARIVAHIRTKLSPAQLQRYGSMEPYALIAWYRHKYNLDFSQLQHEVDHACPG